MTHTLKVRGTKRWSEFNEFEGEVHGELDGVPVVAYLLGVPVEVWDDTFVPGATLQVEAWVELQHGGVEILPPDTPVKLEQVGDGVIYDIVGRLLAQDGEELQVDSVLPMRVDLDWAERFGPPPALRVGDVIRVRGALKIETVG
jgi:hypothetical protein